MRVIFIQLKCELGQSYEVAANLAEQEGVSEVYSVSGPFDLIAKCYLEDEDIGRYVATKIQTLEGVTDTHTLITFNAFT